MNEIRLKAPAKINLTLDIISKRYDGYHNISSIMQTISLFDDIIIKKSPLPGVKVLSNITWLGNDKTNLVYKIAEDIISEYAIDQGITIKLFKRIPVSAGLAGGSSDCATTLKGLIKLFDLPISKYHAYKICERYGADVPFCFMGGTVLTKGIGNVLSRLSAHPKAIVLLAKPKFSVSTSKIFELADTKKLLPPKTPKMIHILKTRNAKKIAANLCNSFEAITSEMHPVIKQIKATMLENNALGASMSGTGPTVFGYFESFGAAKKVAAIIENKFNGTATFIAKTISAQ